MGGAALRAGEVDGLGPRPEIVGALPHVDLRQATPLRDGGTSGPSAFSALAYVAAGLALVAAGVVVSRGPRSKDGGTS